jgi:hypothetical protein
VTDPDEDLRNYVSYLWGEDWDSSEDVVWDSWGQEGDE